MAALDFRDAGMQERRAAAEKRTKKGAHDAHRNKQNCLTMCRWGMKEKRAYILGRAACICRRINCTFAHEFNVKQKGVAGRARRMRARHTLRASRLHIHSCQRCLHVGHASLVVVCVSKAGVLLPGCQQALHGLPEALQPQQRLNLRAGRREEPA